MIIARRIGHEDRVTTKGRKKFIRAFPEVADENLVKSPWISYVHGLEANRAITFEAFVACWKRQHEEHGSKRVWTRLDEAECALALVWLIENGLAEVVDEEKLLH